LLSTSYLQCYQGYDLLSGPFEHLAVNNTEVDILLAQSKKLGDVLSFAFDTPSGIPDNDLDFTSRIPSQSGTNGVATIGTLVLEWTRLSDLTDNPKYGKLTQKAESYLLRPHPASGEPFPGLIGQDVSIASGNITSSGGGWVGGSDSFYEYLIKMWVYDNKRFAEYRDRWIVAADSSIKFMASHPNTRPDLTFLAKWEGRTVNPVWQHRKSSFITTSHTLLTHHCQLAALLAATSSSVVLFLEKTSTLTLASSSQPDAERPTSPP
jgi:mannosyl-oligosaccharide alpha-1,2-mannosidase